MNNAEFIQLIEHRTDLRQDLFIRGFLITDDVTFDRQSFPLYGNWREATKGQYHFLSHPLTGVHFFDATDDKIFFLLGHAYNPYTMEIDEVKILHDLSEALVQNKFLDKVNELTGIFVLGYIDGAELHYLVDPAGIQSACSGKINHQFYLSSHAQLIGDILNLEMTPLVKELVAYKWYKRVMGPYLPGDLTPFAELKRIIPGIYYQYSDRISHQRFWPLKPHNMATDPAEYNQIIQQAADILKNNMILVSQKWSKPWISLTGGIDSNTTFAAGNGIYDKFEAFSYISAPKEIPDTEAAAKIAQKFQMPHHVFHIPTQNAEVQDFDAILEILRHNNGYVAEPPQNEARKRAYLRQHAQCDVEVKSWVSETIRCYWYKHYGRSSMPKLSGKLFRNLYKIFIWNRSLAHKIDQLFKQYIVDYEYDKIPECYPPADLHYNDVTWGSWGSINISEMKYCFDITIIFNNRNFLDLLFKVPIPRRISDRHHWDMKKYLNKELYDMNIRVVNLKETNFRAFALNCIFTLNSILPF